MTAYVKMWQGQKRGTQDAAECVTDFIATLLTSSVLYCCTDPRQHGIYVLNEPLVMIYATVLQGPVV